MCFNHLVSSGVNLVNELCCTFTIILNLLLLISLLEILWVTQTIHFWRILNCMETIMWIVKSHQLGIVALWHCKITEKHYQSSICREVCVYEACKYMGNSLGSPQIVAWCYSYFKNKNIKTKKPQSCYASFNSGFAYICVWKTLSLPVRTAFLLLWRVKWNFYKDYFCWRNILPKTNEIQTNIVIS